MTFDVKLSSQATKFLRNQDSHIAERLKVGLRKLAEPFAHIEHFEGDDCYKHRKVNIVHLLTLTLNERLFGCESWINEEGFTTEPQTRTRTEKDA